MTEDIHSKARRLILESCIEALQHSDQIRLDEHLKNCPVCREYMVTTDATINIFKNISVSMDPNLLRSTQRLVQDRAKKLNSNKELNPVMAGIIAIVTLAWIAVTGIYLWRGFEWIGTRLGLPSLVWQVSFGLWWLLPALVLAAMIVVQTDRNVTFYEN